MKSTFYLRVAKSRRGIITRTSATPNYESLKQGSYGPYLPTIMTKVNIEIDDKEFDKARNELNLKLENVKLAVKLEEERGEKE